jgi:hypothetical protein
MPDAMMRSGDDAQWEGAPKSEIIVNIGGSAGAKRLPRATNIGQK